MLFYVLHKYIRRIDIPVNCFKRLKGVDNVFSCIMEELVPYIFPKFIFLPYQFFYFLKKCLFLLKIMKLMPTLYGIQTSSKKFTSSLTKGENIP